MLQILIRITVIYWFRVYILGCATRVVKKFLKNLNKVHLMNIKNDVEMYSLIKANIKVGPERLSIE